MTFLSRYAFKPINLGVTRHELAAPAPGVGGCLSHLQSDYCDSWSLRTTR